jgi:hypothetical protein
MDTFERSEYVKHIEKMDNEELELETDDTFVQMPCDSDEAQRYLICVSEKKRREGK